MEIRSRSMRLLSSMVQLMAVMRVSTSRLESPSSFSSEARGVLQSHGVTFRTLLMQLVDTKIMFADVCCELLSCVTLGRAASDVNSPHNLLQLGHHNSVTFLSFA